MITTPSISALSGTTSGNVVGLGGASIVSGWIRDGMAAGRDNDNIHWMGQTTRNNVSRHYSTAPITTPMVDHASVAGEADEELVADGELGGMILLLNSPRTFLRLGILSSRDGSLFFGRLHLVWQAIIAWSIHHRIRAIVWLVAKAPFIILGDLWINVYAFMNHDPFANQGPHVSQNRGITEFQILFWKWAHWLRYDAKPWLVSVWEDIKGLPTRGTSFFSRNTKKKRKKWRIPGPTLQGIVADTKSQLEREEEEKELGRLRKEQEAADNSHGGNRRKGRGNGGRKQKKW